MSDSQGPQPSSPKQPLLPGNGSSTDPEQQRLMQAALVLLLVCLAVVLYRDRDFWFPDAAVDVAQQSLQGAPSVVVVNAAPEPKNPRSNKKIGNGVKPNIIEDGLKTAIDQDQSPVPPTTVTRTVLPPLEVEVVAGSAHRTVRPGINSLKIDLERGETPDTEPEVPPKDVASSLETKAAERTTILAEPPDVVAQSVPPGYPLLARQMKVQGSVILQALIGRDGLIQNIHVISGSPILASAAQEAVKQWHFKPHYEGAEAVETQAKITVNFIISTN